MTATSTTNQKTFANVNINLKTAGAILCQHLDIITDNKAGMKHAKFLKDFINEQEYDGEAIMDDLDEGLNGSEIVEALADELSITSEDEKQLKKLWITLKLVFELKHSEFIELLDIDWGVTQEEINIIREYMEVQCPGLIKDGENQGLIIVMAVGKKNGLPNLLSLLYDAYTQYRVVIRLSPDSVGVNMDNNNNNSSRASKKASKRDIGRITFNGPDKTAKEFCDEPYFAHWPLRTRNCMQMALDSFEHRLIPGFKFSTPTELFVDKCDAFIEYTIMVSKALNNFVHNNGKNMLCMPLQADLVIIPAKVVISVETLFDDSDDDDDPEEEEEEEEDVRTDDYKDASGNRSKATAASLEYTFNKVMDKGKYKKEYSKYKLKAFTKKLARRKLTNLITKYIGGGKNCQRISIVIDRRTKPDTVYVFTLPGNNELPPDACIATFMDRSAKFVVPRFNEMMDKAGKFPFVGGRHAEGLFFQVSFQMLTDVRTRLQWYFCGRGVRLTPEIMVKAWPMVFKDCSISKEYTEEFVKTEMHLSDPVFETWSQWTRNIFTHPKRIHMSQNGK